MTKKAVLIDGHSILTRAFFGVPDLTNSKGIHTNAVYGFLNILFKILDEEAPDHLIVSFDLKKPTFRHEIFSEYKGTRKPMPVELHEQVPIIKEVLTSMNIKVITKEGYEADDVLGTLAKDGVKKGYKIVIVSGDRDLLQLAEDDILIRIPKTKKGGTEIENYYHQDVIDTYNVTPEEFIDLKALMGDVSDNIPGVKSIGEKTAIKLITQYKSIENLYENIDTVLPERVKNALITGRDNAFLSKVLATINTNSPIEEYVESGIITDIFNEESYKLIKELEFKSLFSKFDLNSMAEDETISSLFSDFTIISDKTSLMELAEKEHFDFYTGISFNYFENLNIFTSMISIDNVHYYIETSEHLDFKDFIEFISIYQKKNKLSLFDLKSILKWLPLKEDNFILDCKIASYLLNPLKDTYSYVDIGRDFLALTLETKTELFGKKDDFTIYSEDISLYKKVMAYESYVAQKSSTVLLEQLNETNMYELYKDIEYPLIYVLFEMEKNGIRVNGQELKIYGDSLQSTIVKIEKQIYEEIGEEFNINSPKQLGEILFVKMEIPGGKKTKTGYSTSADVLEKLSTTYPVVNKILEYRQLTKLKSTYADGLANYISYDGRIHGTFNQTIAATGRISSTEPNLQNIPIRMEIGRQIRKVFIPEDDYIFIDADYSQIELRILAHMSGDQHLINAYNSDQDIHKITASKVFHTPIDQVTKEMRSNAKAVNFGIVYGISSFGLSQDLSITKKEAGEYIKEYFESYPAIKDFLDNTVENAKKNGYTTTEFNRRRPIPELASSNFMQRAFGERAAMNSSIQGTAADIIKIAMISVYRQLKENDLKSRLILQVHDEILIETHKSEIEIVKNIVITSMMNAADLKVKLEVGLETGDNWLDAH